LRTLPSVVQVNTVTSAMAYMSVGYDNSWDHEKWADDFQIVVTRREKDLLELEMINVDPSIVNSLRRILISEVPTVAIEHVFVIDNNSEMAEEVIAHRLGLVPLTVDAEELVDKDGSATEENTVVFKLHVHCNKVRGRFCCCLSHTRHLLRHSLRHALAHLTVHKHAICSAGHMRASNSCLVYASKACASWKRSAQPRLCLNRSWRAGRQRRRHQQPRYG
jgi:glutamine phosphoribosylpyrophosphate amidotransferase